MAAGDDSGSPDFGAALGPVWAEIDAALERPALRQDEFTAQMYAQRQRLTLAQANYRLGQAVNAGKLVKRWIFMGNKWQWSYSLPESDAVMEPALLRESRIGAVAVTK